MNYKFKTNQNDIALDSQDSVKIINIALAQQTSRNIDIISKNLDQNIFGTDDFIETVKQLSISSKFTKMRILVKNSEHIIQNSHKLIELVHQLTSSIEVRKVSEEYKSYNEAFSLYDGRAVLYLRYAERYEGFANFNRPRLATELSNFFNEVWEHSTPDENMRRLNI